MSVMKYLYIVCMCVYVTDVL